MNQKAVEAVTNVLADSEALHCTRNWSAWKYDTMTEEDFVPASEEPTLIEDLINAARPHLEAELRQKIAADIRAGKAPITQITNIMYNAGIEDAALIVEGKQ